LNLFFGNVVVFKKERGREKYLLGIPEKRNNKVYLRNCLFDELFFLEIIKIGKKRVRIIFGKLFIIIVV
jgi:hypothetical protein